MDAEENAADGAVEYGIPEAAEFAHDTGADGSWLVGDWGIGIICISEVTADAVELFGDEVEGDVIGRIIGEVKIISLFVVEAGRLEASANEGGMAGRIFPSVSTAVESHRKEGISAHKLGREAL